MERLTGHSGDSVFIKGCKTLYANQERKGAPASNAIVRLAAYEDTGLSPEEIKALIAPTNDPLTLDELREMDREWVWIDRICEYPNSIKKFINGYGFVLVPESFVVVIEAKFKFEEYGKTWLAYRRKPEEGTK